MSSMQHNNKSLKSGYTATPHHFYHHGKPKHPLGLAHKLKSAIGKKRDWDEENNSFIRGYN